MICNNRNLITPTKISTNEIDLLKKHENLYLENKDVYSTNENSNLPSPYTPSHYEQQYLTGTQLVG